MADSGFFKGTSADQDRRFPDKERKLLKSMKFPPEFDKKVDLRKVNLSLIKPWIAKKVTELVGFEDDIVIDYAMGLLENTSETLDPRKMQINLTGFLTNDTPAFMSALWKLLLEAQQDVTGIPRSFVEEKKEELRRARENDTRVFDERDRRARLDEIRDSDRGGFRGRGRGRGKGRGIGFDDDRPRDNGYAGRGRGGGRPPPRSPPSRRYSPSPPPRRYRRSKSRSFSRSPPPRRRPRSRSRSFTPPGRRRGSPPPPSRKRRLSPLSSSRSRSRSRTPPRYNRRRTRSPTPPSSRGYPSPPRRSPSRSISRPRSPLRRRSMSRERRRPKRSRDYSPSPSRSSRRSLSPERKMDVDKGGELKIKGQAEAMKKKSRWDDDEERGPVQSKLALEKRESELKEKALRNKVVKSRRENDD